MNTFYVTVFHTYTRKTEQPVVQIWGRSRYIWFVLCESSFLVSLTCLENVAPRMFWAIADIYPDLVARRHVKVRLMDNFGLNGGIPWLALSASLAEKITEHFVISFLTVPLSSQILTHSWCNLLPIWMLPMELKFHSSSPAYIGSTKRFRWLDASVSLL